MQVKVRGLNQSGKEQQRVWNLSARSNHGPEIPCAPALAVARKLVRGEIATRGAMPCLGLITLDDFDEEMAAFDVSWQFETPML
jgi:hypothetical protein